MISTKVQIQKKVVSALAPKDNGVLQSKSLHLGKNRRALQHRAIITIGPETLPPIVNDVLLSSGQPLDHATRVFMETRFAHEYSKVPTHSMSPQTATDDLAIGSPDDAYEQDAKQTAERIMHNPNVVQAKEASSLKRFDFSQVRVHTDNRASESAQAINALAYTIGRNVVFRSGQYAPGTKEGKKLLAHELAHAVQQNGQSCGKACKMIQRDEARDASTISACTNPVFYIHLDTPSIFIGDRYFRNDEELSESDWESRLKEDRSRQNSCEIYLSREIEITGPNPTVNAYLIYTRTPCCNCFAGKISWNILANGRRIEDELSLGSCPGPICCTISKSVPLNLSILGYTISGTVALRGNTHNRNWRRPPLIKKLCPLDSEVPLSNCLCPKERVNPQSNTCCPEGQQAGLSGKCESKKPPPPPSPEKVEMQFNKDAPQWWYDPASSFKVSLTPGGRAAFEEIVAKMESQPALRVQLEGRASSDRPANDEGYNRRLTDRRVRLIASELEKRGIPKTRLDSPADQSSPSGCEEIDTESSRGLLSCGDESAKVPPDPSDRKVVASLFQ